jgi:predicted Zn-dependent peptidase
LIELTKKSALMNLFKKYIGILFLLLCLISVSSDSFAQLKTVNDGRYSYQTVENDPLKARIYTLANGLKVYLSVYKDAPRIQTYIAVKTGSRNDPHDAQGLAHYLEHMLFKGTDRFGTKDFEKEKPLLDEIIDLYEKRRQTNDPVERAAIYKQIDSVSYLASEYAIANEYDKMIASIGTNDNNAHTSLDETVYQSDIPSNQISKWLTIESERFRNPVMRLFHTELEAVYEEKNRGLDNDNSKIFEALFAGLFGEHTYGSQTTIGSVEQLKNPSIKKVLDYLHNFYVPNNMAITLSGDFDPDAVIKMVDDTFGKLPPGEVKMPVIPDAGAITSPVVKEVLGPDQESVTIGFRFAGANSNDAEMMRLVDFILSNSASGLIDLNINQQQKAIDAYSTTENYHDYSAAFLGGNPKQGQSLDEVKDLLLSQIDLIKKGSFPDWLISAIINDFKLRQLKDYENNVNRASAMYDSFIKDEPWDHYVSLIDRLSRITRQDVIDFVNANYKDNYVIVYKRTGEDKNIAKVEKPPINPVKVNSQDRSPFLETFINTPSEPIKPVFVDYKKDIQELKLNNNSPVYFIKNVENEIYDLFYSIDIGTNNDRKLSLALNYLPYLGTSRLTPEQLKQEFYKIGSSFSVTGTEDQVLVSLTGLNKNFNKALTLLEEVLADAKPDKTALDNLVNDIIKKRKDAKLNKRTILWSGMYNYGKYGPVNPFTDRLSEKELKSVKPEELISIIKGLAGFKHSVLYYGPESSSSLVSVVSSMHKTPAVLKTVPAVTKYEEKDLNDRMVYVVDYDMQQAEIVMLSKSEKYNKENIPVISLFNEYFGGGMQSVVFQDLRESKALAYSAFSEYQTPPYRDRSNYILAYIGSQADKLPEAMAGMVSLLNKMPETENLFGSAKSSLIGQLESQRITKAGILTSYLAAKKLGLDYDIRKDIYTKLPSLTFNDVKNFQKKYIKDKNYVILILGDKKKLDTKTLSKYGTVKYLSLKDIFGY